MTRQPKGGVGEGALRETLLEKINHSADISTPMLNLAGIEIDALSVGGLRTCIQIPSMDLAFDMGVCPPRAVHRRTVLFTHAHVDHMGAVAQHCATRSLMNLKPPIYVIPPSNADAFSALLTAWRQLDRNDFACTVHPVGPGGEVPLSKGLIARPVQAVHRVAAQGYVVYRRKKKLKAEWLGRSHNEIRLARESGVEITDLVETPEVAFTGDSRIEIFDLNPEMYLARVLLMEVTFVDEKVPVEKCRRQGHIHLDEVIERADLFHNEAILFTHLSARYSGEMAQAILDARLPPRLAERVVLLHPPK